MSRWNSINPGVEHLTLSFSSPSIRAMASLVFSLCSCDDFSSSMRRTMLSTCSRITMVPSYSWLVASVCCESKDFSSRCLANPLSLWNLTKSKFWNSNGYFNNLWKGLLREITKPLSPRSPAVSSRLCKIRISLVLGHGVRDGSNSPADIVPSEPLQALDLYPISCWRPPRRARRIQPVEVPFRGATRRCCID